MRREKISDYLTDDHYETVIAYKDMSRAVKWFAWEHIYVGFDVSNEQNIKAYDREGYFPFWRIKNVKGRFEVQRLKLDAMEKMIKVFETLDTL